MVMKLLSIAMIVAVASAISREEMRALDEKYAPKYDGFANNGLKGTITMYANTHSTKKGNLKDIEQKDAEAGWAKPAAKDGHESRLFQDMPILSKGYDEVQAGSKGFRFRSEKANDEVYCQAQNEKGLRTADGSAIEFKFACDKMSGADKSRFQSYFAYLPYHWNGGGYWASPATTTYAVGYPWYGGGGYGWGYGWGYPSYGWAW